MRHFPTASLSLDISGKRDILSRHHEKTIFAALLLLAIPQVFAKAPVATDELNAYVSTPDPTTSWKIVTKAKVGESDVWHISLTSQTWQGIVWTHDLLIIRPKSAPLTDKILLVNSGGSFKPSNMKELMIGATLAEQINAPVAVLLGIPKQPLFGGLKEDKLIAETFVKYLETGDATWPLLFPMVKSVVKAMDTIEEFTKTEWEQPVGKFIISGASKRGWTTWLTAAADPRVTAIAPMVIDMLNITKQLPHQKESYGTISEQIKPYLERGLVPIKDGERDKALWNMVDPFTYREKYTMPKIIVLGTNDRFWTTDALNLYWDEIPGPKYISYTPNAGHSLTQMSEDGGKPNPMRAINNISAFVRLHLKDKLPPAITWKHGNSEDGRLEMDVTTDTPPEQARLWYATAKTKDFRDAKWESKDLALPVDGKLHLDHDAPKEGYYAYFVDLAYPVDDLTLWLCTQLRIAGPSNQ